MHSPLANFAGRSDFNKERTGVIRFDVALLHNSLQAA
jgi:hypothetical protein